MLFNSFEFLFLFLPIALIIHYLVGVFSVSTAIGWLGLASVFFYACWSPAYTILLLASIAFNYTCGLLIVKHLYSSIILTFAIIINLLTLAFFKYVDLLIITLHNTTGLEISPFQIILPIGISFFTFTQIAFLVDARKGLATEYSFSNYLLFVTYFPHLIAGPVLHHKQMMPQFCNPDIFKPRFENFSIGIAFLVIGLTKKILIADQFAPYASGMFDGSSQAAHAPNFILAWIGVLSYTFQIYFDFSGYSDMAIGLSRLFGVNLPLNFNSPYKSNNIIEFWRRWHISLSQFLRDYLYIPLGGNRKGSLHRYANLMITMLLGGLWHGANWTFLAWGGLHGAYLILNHTWKSVVGRLSWKNPGVSHLWNAASWLLTFVAVMIAWVFFRSPDFATAYKVLSGMIGLNGVTAPVGMKGQLGQLGDIVSSWGVQFASPVLSFGGAEIGSLSRISTLIALGFALIACPNSQKLLESWETTQPKEEKCWSAAPLGVAAAILFLLCIGHMSHRSEFLYYQF